MEELSVRRGEPPWLTDFRLRSLALLDDGAFPGGPPALMDVLPGADGASAPLLSAWERRPPDRFRASEQPGNASGALGEGLRRQGVLFMDTDTAVRTHADLLHTYLGTLVPPSAGRAAALNGALWSGGVFLYVPAGVEVQVPLQVSPPGAVPEAAPFERTLVVAGPGSRVHYVEGCTAPAYTARSLRSSVVEVIAGEGAQVRYTAFQNWSTNVRSWVTKSAVALGDATVVWTDVDLGSRRTIRDISVTLAGPGARGELLSFAWAEAGQEQEAFGHLAFGAPHTSGLVLSKTVSAGGGRARNRGRISAHPGIADVHAGFQRDALSLGPGPLVDPLPPLEVEASGVSVTEEESLVQVGAEELFYSMSRGLSETEARILLLRGFIQPIAARLPMEYTVELDRLLALRMDGGVG